MALRRAGCIGSVAAALLLAWPALGGAAHLPHTRTLFVVGDSLTVGTRPYLHRYLHGWRIRTDATISKHEFEGPRDLHRLGRHLPRVVFVNLGTNDSPGAVGAFVHVLRRMMRIAGSRRCVVWATILRPPVGGVSYTRMNRALVEQARRRRNLMVFRWVRLARRHPYWFGPDHVHPTATGYRVRARAMARTIRACRREVVRTDRRRRHR